MKKVMLTICLLLIAVAEGCKKEPESPGPTQKQRVEAALQYLDDISELKGWKVDGSDLYLAFRSLPSDWKAVTCAAAFNFHEVRGGRVYAWAIRDCDLNNVRLSSNWRYYGFRPGEISVSNDR